MIQEKTKGGIMDLPTDLMFGIFFRLECKDVMSCRSVCRTWYNLLSDPNFSSNYSRYSPFTTILVSHHNCYSNYIFLIQVTANGEFIRRQIKPKVLKTSKRTSSQTLKRYSEEILSMKVIGSCNGLVFLLQDIRDSPYERNQSEKIYYCYPLLGECVKLIEFTRANKLVYFVKYEVGFVPSTNKIKLLRMGFSLTGKVAEAHILTFRADDQWRKLKDPFTHLDHVTDGICYNGSYHWIDRSGNIDGICTFDFGEEKCGRIPKPSGLLKLSNLMRMAVLNDHLCFIELMNRQPEMNIWIMKEYGVAESWSKDIVIVLRGSCMFLPDLFPIATLPNGDILFSELGNGIPIFSHARKVLPEGGFLKFSHKRKRCTVVQFRDGYPATGLLYASTYAPIFYALEEDVSGQKH